jgi:hypothetical protein
MQLLRLLEEENAEGSSRNVLNISNYSEKRNINQNKQTIESLNSSGSLYQKKTLSKKSIQFN